MFQCIRIPADESAPIETISLSKSGGLTNDALAAHAKQYFAQKYQGETSSTDPYATASCLDITAVTVPMKGNDYRAVSLYKYGGDSSQLPVNQRAMTLVQACGHALSSSIQGDVFVGRARDDENADIWERVDFTADDALPTADWCRTARQTGGGGGTGKAAASSLSGLLQQTQTNGNNLQVLSGDGSSGGADASLSFGRNGAAAVQAFGYTWTQDSDEVELKFPVAPETVTKDCKVVFGRNAIKVTVAGKVLLDGSTFLPVVADECTWTLTRDAANSDQKDLTVTLMKEESSKTWTFVVQ
ncbi:hypothetical protein MPSEU_000642600 [Mayamaea pseudoterrestris]|nr:hypothetical protein MPSEU_000642600 [Mayamaea pseudoterrestris]